MTVAETAKKLNITEQRLVGYIERRIVRPSPDGLSDLEKSRLSMAMVLEDFGFLPEEIADFLDCGEAGAFGRQKRMLAAKRGGLLDTVHDYENRLVKLDFLINEIGRKKSG